jgi:hypothetical protein
MIVVAVLPHSQPKPHRWATINIVTVVVIVMAIRSIRVPIKVTAVEAFLVKALMRFIGLRSIADLLDIWRLVHKAGPAYGPGLGRRRQQEPCGKQGRN